MSLSLRTEAGRCKGCDHWAFMDKTIGECTLSELTRADSLHVAVIYTNTDDNKLMYTRTDNPNYRAVLETDASFGCISFEPRQD